MTEKAVFYHARCSVCIDAERRFAGALDKSLVHLGESKDRIDEAEQAGVTSVPALVVAVSVFHINRGADLSALR